jgi:hypothetical protein
MVMPDVNWKKTAVEFKSTQAPAFDIIPRIPCDDANLPHPSLRADAKRYADVGSAI